MSVIKRKLGGAAEFVGFALQILEVPIQAVESVAGNFCLNSTRKVSSLVWQNFARRRSWRVSVAPSSVRSILVRKLGVLWASRRNERTVRIPTKVVLRRPLRENSYA